MNTPYFILFSFSFPLFQTHQTLSLLFPFSLCRPWTSYAFLLHYGFYI